MSNVKQGEYVFTARSDDYGYFGTSEKVLVSEDKNYYVNVELKPSQPLLRVRAVDESWNKLVGPGTIAIYEVTNYLDKYGAGDWKTDEREVSSASFDSASEMNALFYLWAPKNELDSSSHFKVVLSKDNYGKSVQEYVWVGDKYQDQSFQIIKEKPKTGNLKVTVVPGVGTTLADLNVLIGKKVGIVPVSGTGEQYTEIISPDLTVTLSNYSYGQYNLWFYNTYDNQVPPVTIEYSIVTVDSDAGYAKVNGLLGSLLKLSITDSALKLLDTNLVSVYQICGYDQDNNYCSDYNGKSWVAVSGGASNPYTIPLQLSSEADLNRYSQMKYSFELGYAEMKKTFVFPYFKQGVNSVFLTFDPTPEVAAKAAWKVAQPWAITDWKRDANGLSVVLKNNTTETLIYSDMSINSTQKNTASGKVLAGATVVKNFPMTKCGSGMIYTYSKSGIVITYSTTAITGKKMSGVADIVVTCA
jgi:hypothetical protein